MLKGPSWKEKRSFLRPQTQEARKKLSETSMTQEANSSVLATFLKTNMKLLRYKKVVEGLQVLSDKCANKEKTHVEKHTMRKIGKHRKCTGCEMRLTTQIGEYEMDQVILDLGSDTNVLPNKTWERMGRHVL